MNEIRYELIIYWSDVDQAFIVEVPELSGCKADGETYEEAINNLYMEMLLIDSTPKGSHKALRTYS